MKQTHSYVVLSLELHLFFARIMKEHALFLEAGFTPKDAAFAKRADQFKQEFERLLFRAVRLSDCVVRKEVLCSGEIVTEFTQCAEQQTQRLTGIHIDQRITELECRLREQDKSAFHPGLVREVKALNNTALQLLDGLITFKERILCDVETCRMFTMNYPLLIEHILREAKLYRSCLINYEKGCDLDCQTLRETTLFWNQIMMEHALFIRGLLDPTEEDLIKASNGFAQDYARLLERAQARNDMTISASAEEALAQTVKFREFKAAGTKGIEDCQIRSLILPLLADHVLREANHYIRLLRCEA